MRLSINWMGLGFILAICGITALMLWPGVARAAEHHIPFEVITPPSTPTDAKVYVTGNHPDRGIAGTVRYHRGLTGRDLRHPRDVIVWLPPSYARKNLKRRYPVLYMHDGQNIIDPSTSFLGADWRVDEEVDRLIRENRIEEIIVVGIYNSPDRSFEYSDTDLGRSYARFVVEELKPFIDRTYRTKTTRDHTAVMGSSMGGRISFLFTWWHPEIFSKSACLSSAFFAPDDKLLMEVRGYEGKRKNVRIYLDDGSEGIDAKLKPGYEEMVGILEAKGYRKGRDLEYFFDDGAEHNEMAWARRIWRPLTFLFGKSPRADQIGGVKPVGRRR